MDQSLRASPQRDDIARPASVPSKPARADSLSEKLLGLFRGSSSSAVQPEIISLPTSKHGAFSSTSGDESDLGASGMGSPDMVATGDAPPGEQPQRSFLDTMWQWREVAPPPQTVPLMADGDVAEGFEPPAGTTADPSAPAGSTGGGAPPGDVGMMGKLLRFLPAKLSDSVGPLNLHIRSVTGEEFDLSLAGGLTSEIGVKIRDEIERQGSRSQKRLSRAPFSLERFVQQLHIKGSGRSGPVQQARDPALEASTAAAAAAAAATAAAAAAASGGSGAAAASGATGSSSASAQLQPAPPLLLQRIPDVFASCNRMTSLAVEGQQLVTLDDVCKAEMLEELRVNRCELRDVPQQLFQSLPRLRLLDLAGNQLTWLGGNSSADRMQFLNLAHNLVAAVPPQLCRMTTLTDLDLSYNRLSSLPAELQQLSMLFRLNLEGNALTTPSVALIRGVMGSIDAVTRFPQLAALNLSRNRITEFPARVDLLQCLTELNLADNRLTRVAPELTALPTLATLDLSGNAFGPDFPLEVAQIKSLHVLRLARNKIRALPEALTTLRNLVELDVSSNRLRHIDSAALVGLTSVLRLDVANNKLEDAEFLLELAGLQHVDLSQNALRKLPADIYHLEALTRMQLAHNRLLVLPESFDRLYRLEEVDLSHNGLERLSASWNVSSFPRLRVVLLEGNARAVSSLHFSFSTLRSITCLSLLGVTIDMDNICIENPARFDLTQFIDVTARVRHPLLVAAFFGLATVPEHSQQILLHGVELMLNLCSVREVLSKSLLVHDVWPPTDIYLPDTARYLALRCLTMLTHKMDANIARWHIYVHGAPAVLMDIINRHPDVRFKLVCIRLLGNLALHQMVKSQIFHEKSEIVTYLEDLARTTHSDSIKRFCNRTFAIFGICQHFHTSLVSAALSKHAGVRILSLDGGGTRSLATVEVLIKIRDMTGKRLVDMFDLIVGSSAGGLVALGLLTGKTLEESADMYLEKGHLCFAPQDEVHEEAPPENRGANTTWSKTLRPLFNLATKGAMYRSKSFEKELRRFFGPSTTMIGTAEDESSPKVCVVTTLTSVKPAVPYLCRNYDYPPHRVSRHDGDVTWRLWEVARATSAAPSFFDPFERDGRQLMDGGVVANNPTGVAMHEARKIWGPDVPISLVLSIGTGMPFSVPVPKDRGMIETLEQLADAALSQERVHEMMEDLVGDGIPYVRLQPTAAVFSARMDETRKSELQKLQQDTRAWIAQNEASFNAVRDILLEKKKPQPVVVWHDENLSKRSESEADDTRDE